MSRKSDKGKKKRKMFRDAKKKMQRVKLQEATRIPKKQYQRWAAGFEPLPADDRETDRDPDYVAFCVAKQVEEWNEFDFLWLRIATALRLGRYTFKAIDRTNRLRLFDKEAFTKSVEDGEFDHEHGLQYEADKALCYLVFGDHPRFRELFGFVLMPWIDNDLAADLDTNQYNVWFSKDPSDDLAKRLAEFDVAKVE